MAEAITSSGRHTIQQCEIFVDELLNEPTEEMKSIINEIKAWHFLRMLYNVGVKDVNIR